MTVQDMLSSLKPHRRSHRTDAKVLQGLVWLDHSLYLAELDLSNFAQKFLDHHTDRSGLIYKWANGKAAPNDETRRRIDKKLPGSCAVYDLPLFSLLDPRPLSKNQVSKLLAIYKAPDSDLFPWKFPNDDEMETQNRCARTMIRDDSTALLSRGDIYGFTVIIGLVREAEAKGDMNALLVHLTNAYRAFPAVARIPWYRNHANLLRKCVDTIRYRNYVVGMTFDVDWTVISKQINAAEHEMLRERCPRDPKTRRFILPEDPIVYREPALDMEAMPFDISPFSENNQR